MTWSCIVEVRIQKLWCTVPKKSDIEGNWQKLADFVPYKGEYIVYLPEKGKTWTDNNGTIHTGTCEFARIKIGDGTTTINNLPFVSNNVGELIEQDGELLFLI